MSRLWTDGRTDARTECEDRARILETEFAIRTYRKLTFRSRLIHKATRIPLTCHQNTGNTKNTRYVALPLVLPLCSEENCGHSQKSQSSRMRWMASSVLPSRPLWICSTSWLPSMQPESQGEICWRWCSVQLQQRI